MPPKLILVDQYIKSGNSILLSLKQTISEQCRLLQIVRQNLPESLAEFVVGCVLKKSKLILFTESGAPASKLRFHSPVLLNALNANSAIPIESLALRVIQTKKQETLRHITQKLPSRASIATLRECSYTFSDTKLQQSLKRLADTLEKRHEKNEWKALARGRPRPFTLGGEAGSSCNTKSKATPVPSHDKR
ncbi:MAG: hypothetical protein ACRERV_05415 [Methylococcales bacterium]